ncbi:MAG: hypothetical protein HYX41_01400 [Bdellovibrio sp.]|nr:hypothetical protein [Bdellovibrio sp.]
MSSSWDSYYIVFLSAVLSLGIPSVLALLSSAVFQKKRSAHLRQTPDLPAPNQTVLGQKINVRFFLAANAALILFGLALELVPCATTLQAGNHEGLLRGLLAIVSVAGFSVLGLLYSVRKGDMSWVDSFQSMENRSTPKDKEKGF